MSSEEKVDSLMELAEPEPEERRGGELVGDDVVMPSLFSHIVKSLRPGQDLTRVMIPVFFLEPRSLLERFTDLGMHLDLLLEVSDEEDPFQRMVKVTKWFLSGWHYKTKGIKKPFNPVIGETFSCFYKHKDSVSEYFAEQVSHHPPVTAFYFENRRKGLVINGQVWTKSRFMGNSSSVQLVGGLTLHNTKHDERYEFTLPTLYANGLFIGTLRMEVGDKCNIRCHKTGHTAQIEFRQKPMWGGEMRRVKAEIFRDGTTRELLVEGKWDKQLTATPAGGGSPYTFLDVEALPILPKYTLPVDRMGMWESRRLWAEAAALMRARDPDWDRVQLYKAALEEEQRRVPCHVDPEVHPWATKMFHEKEVEWNGKPQKVWVFDNICLDPPRPDAVPHDLVTLSATLPDTRDRSGKEELEGLSDEEVRGAASKAPAISTAKVV